MCAWVVVCICLACVHMSRISCISGDVLPVCRRVPCARCMSCGTCAANVMSCAYISLCPCLRLFCTKCLCRCVSVPNRLCPSHSSIRASLVAMPSSPASGSTRGSSSPTPSTQSTVMESCVGNVGKQFFHINLHARCVRQTKII